MGKSTSMENKYQRIRISLVSVTLRNTALLEI